MVETLRAFWSNWRASGAKGHAKRKRLDPLVSIQFDPPGSLINKL